MVEFLSIFAAIVLFCYFLSYKNKKYKEEKEMESIANAPNMSRNPEVLPLNNTSMEENKNISTRDLCVEILRKLNCEVQFDEENENTLLFSYQGEDFRIDTWNNCFTIVIWDVWWGTVDLDDLDDVSRIRKAINTMNINYSLTMVYSIDQENQRFAVHTKRPCLLIPEIPDIEHYLAAMLAGFFEIQRNFKDELDTLRREDEAAKIKK